MKNHPDVMTALAEARPAQLDPSGTPPLPVPVWEGTAPARRFRPALLIPAGALAAVVAAVVVAVSVPEPGPAPDTEVARPLTASQLLLTAAEHSTTDAFGSGKYVVTRSEEGSTITVGAGTATYEMTAKTSYETWLSRSGNESNRVISTKLGMTPLTPADDAAWRAAGSPHEVLVGKPLPDGKLGPGYPVSIDAGAPEANSSDNPEVYAFGNTNVTVRDLEKLPADPEALRARLLKSWDGGGGDVPTDRQQWLLSVASSLLTDIPVSGPVRAAAFRLIATLPGVRSLGVVADQHGRRGQGFAFTTGNATYGSIEQRFVIDTATGRALGRETRVVQAAGTTARLDPGSVLAYSVVLDQRTTDEAPPK
ncbi:CU044_5270 family protein [Paractinoplanes toevensis]|uniref:CU044_5270 family protein n=1 Tax=Paractinoplanes toevensis TaxID=571911 RepID=A0A919TEM1_9ACTN|nr:CU044_5270 family protein [Actinoplanes toevensis]GIM93922.1 hypothetical protein Ato02nite_057150 [Actinoplanes toevensis]